MFSSSILLNTDSYKMSHYSLYPKNVTGMHSYIESRSTNENIVFFGLQMWLKNLKPITAEDINEVEHFAKLHGEPFNRAGWEYILTKYNGHLPITIKALPEGTVTTSGQPLVTVESTDPVVFWVVSYIETALLRAVWYPTTIASNDLKNFNILQKYYNRYSDNKDAVQFALHDFGGRGGTSEESVQIASAAHLLYFRGSDSISGVLAANKYYNCDMSAFSIPATEHSIQCSYGPQFQREYIKTVLDTYAKQNSIVALVLDGYDIIRESKLLCTEFKDQIINSGAKIVFRPDSGNPLDIIPRILFMQEEAFGYVKNSKALKVINNVGIIQGDGIDSETMDAILKSVVNLGYAPENVIFGSGGALLQKVNRDTYKFAQKCSAVLIDGKWEPVYKNPVTDPGKKSKAGIQTTADMITYYENGVMKVDDSLETIRLRAVLPYNRIFNAAA